MSCLDSLGLINCRSRSLSAEFSFNASPMALTPSGPIELAKRGLLIKRDKAVFIWGQVWWASCLISTPQRLLLLLHHQLSSLYSKVEKKRKESMTLLERFNRFSPFSIFSLISSNEIIVPSPAVQKFNLSKAPTPQKEATSKSSSVLRS